MMRGDKAEIERLREVIRADQAEHERIVLALGEQRDRLRRALEEIGAYGGPLYLLAPNQGERPDPAEAARLLREIVEQALDG